MTQPPAKLSETALRYAANHHEIYSIDQARAVADHYDNVAREITVALAGSSVSHSHRPAEVRRARELWILDEAVGAVEYANWRLDHLTTPRIYEMRVDAEARFLHIHPHIRERIWKLNADMLLGKRNFALDLGNVSKGWTQGYLQRLYAESLTEVPWDLRDFIEWITVYGSTFSHFLDPREDDWEAQFAIDKRDEILALYEWLRHDDVLQDEE